MTGNEMLTNLGLRLEDPAQSVFTQAAKLDAINIAQKTVVNMVDAGYLTELEETTGAGTDSAGQCSISGIDPIRGNILGVYSSSASKWCSMVETKDIQSLDNSYISGDSSNPIAYIFNETIYVKPAAVTSLEIWYLKAPDDLGAGTTECELNPALQEMVLDFAESQLWRMDGKSDRASAAYNNALNTVKVLNERYATESPIGSKSR